MQSKVSRAQEAKIYWFIYTTCKFYFLLA